jgi:hypothetical protein
MYFDVIGLAPSAAGRIGARSIRFWFFLAGRRFAAKTPSQEGWISLDFLGFSRPNRDFSMGYEDLSLNEFSRALCGGGQRRNGRQRPWHAEDRSWGELSTVSDFLQAIVVRQKLSCRSRNYRRCRSLSAASIEEQRA